MTLSFSKVFLLFLYLSKIIRCYVCDFNMDIWRHKGTYRNINGHKGTYKDIDEHIETEGRKRRYRDIQGHKGI